MEITDLKDKWTTEFAPKTIDDMVLTKDLKQYFNDLINSKTKFDCLLAGKAGIGKTTIANILSNSLNCTTKFVECGKFGTVAFAQGPINEFVQTCSIDGKPKMVIMDELDCSSGTQDSSFQKTMRSVISFSDTLGQESTMFIGTCNYIDKVIEPIQSRLGVIELSFEPKDLMLKLKSILDTKEIKYTTKSLTEFVGKVFKPLYPDVRQIISNLQKCCSSGKLIVPEKIESVNNKFIEEIVNHCKSDNLLDVRQFYISNQTQISDYIRTASTLFNYVVDNGIVIDPDAIMKMGNVIYQLNVVIDKEVSFFHLLTVIQKYIKK